MPLVSDLSAIPLELLETAQSEAAIEGHDALAARIPALREIEYRPPLQGQEDPKSELILAAWNLERCKHIEATAARLSEVGADIVFLSEMDLGMVRSGNRHTTRDLAKALGGEFGYAFATEFVEIGLGNQTETVEHAGERNSHSLHGNAIISRLALNDLAVVALEDACGGSWWNLDWHHRRIGGRNALAATVKIQGRLVRVVSTHFESLPGPERRVDQARRIVEHLDQSIGRDAPAIVAGDLNCSMLPKEAPSPDSGLPEWFVRPGSYEEMFSIFAEAGFSWQLANTASPTRRTLANGWPPPPFNRLDWFLVRGLPVSNPSVWPAVDENGAAISDHELITLAVKADA